MIERAESICKACEENMERQIARSTSLRATATRERRREILKSLLFSLFDRKDGNRIFTPEQRRIIWNSEDKRLCAKCKKPLTWEDFTVDHVLAFAKGGTTSLKNAQAMHQWCNSSKGAG